MYKQPATQEEKKLINSKKKNKSGPRTNVFYNKKKKDGSSAYLTGKFFSAKNNTHMTYRSSYELKFFTILEEDPKIIAYQSETVAITYKDSTGKSRTYIPDVIATHDTGDIFIYEIKPKVMLVNADVRLKAKACVKFFKEILKGKEIKATYKFITEDDLFESYKDYSDFVKYNNLARK